MKNRFFYLGMLMFASFGASNSYAETYPSIKFEIPKSEGGVINTYATYGFSDSDGFVWFSTSLGLFRYDGYSIKGFQHDPDNSSSLSSNITTALLEGNDGTIWIGTDLAGFNRFDPKTEMITRYLHNDLKGARILNLYMDSGNMLWVSTKTKGLFLFNPEDESLKKFIPKENDDNSISDLSILEVIEDPKSKGNMWIATAKGLNFFNRATGKFTRYLPNEKNSSSISHEYIKDLFFDRKGNLWIGTARGLNSFNILSKSFSHYYPNEKNFQKVGDDNSISAIFEDSYGTLWIGTYNRGLRIFDRQVKSFTPYVHERYNINSLRSNYITNHGIFQDDKDILWILTEGGINYTNLKARYINNFKNNDTNPESLSGNSVKSVYEDIKGNLWVGTNSSGLNFFDEKNKRFIRYTNKQIFPNNIDKGAIHSILVDKYKTLWLATSNGLIKRDKNESNFNRYNFDSEVHSGFSNNRMISLLEDRSGQIWIGSTRGLRKYIRSDDSFKVYLHDKKNKNSLSNNVILDLFQDRSNRLWVGTSNGLNLFDPVEEKVTRYMHDPNNENTISHNIIVDTKQTRDGLLWFGSEGGGLNSLDFEKGVFRRYGKKDGLNSKLITGVLEDNDGGLWLTTGGGLIYFDRNNSKFKDFNSSDGIQGSYFFLSTVVRKNGDIAIGGNRGLDLFNPRKVLEVFDKPRQKDQLVFTDFLVFNRPSKIKSSALLETDTEIKLTENPYYLDKNINYLDKITLTHHESMFSFEFAALTFIRPEAYQYSYKLEGQDKDWITTSSSRRLATYTNVPPGDYTFNVRARHWGEQWNEQGKSIKITILPPPWLTWWAKTIYVILTISLLLGIYTYRTRSLRKRAAMLEQTVKSRTLELAQEKNKVEHLLEEKTEEFANVSHEFRTPLTLILGPLAQLLKDKPTEKQISRLNVIQRNGYRLMRMVDQLLNLETFRIKPEIRRYPINTKKLIQQFTDAFTDLAAEKSIAIQVKHLADVSFEFTHDAFEKIILNLLSNAVKYTEKNGTITIESKRKKDELIILIEDTGIGIPKDKVESIFERFNRVLDERSEKVTGAGIGLSLVKILVDAHQGKIELDSELGQGTSIKLSLPILNEVDSSEIESSDSSELIEMELITLSEYSNSQVENEKSIEIEEQSNTKPCVLVIEDNEDMRSYITENISSDYQVITASNGEEGVTLAKQEIPDLIISDIMMPKKDGFETTKELRSNDITSHIPIILLTALGDSENRIKGWQEKADEYLTKPFNTEELKTRIVNLLEIRNILKRRFGETVFEKNETADDIKSSIINDLTIAEKNKNQLQQQFIQMINEKLETRYSDASISVADLASILAMSERQISRKLKSTVDMTPSEYLRRFRLEKAKEELKKGNSPSNTAFDVGFSSQSYFAKCFKAQYGLSPTEYMNRN